MKKQTFPSYTFGWIGMYFWMMDFVRQNPMLVKCVDKSEFTGESKNALFF